MFEARTIRRMELLVLSTLRWRMLAVTPFSFIDHFLRKINGDDQIPVKASILRAIQVILTTNKGQSLFIFLSPPYNRVMCYLIYKFIISDKQL